MKTIVVNKRFEKYDVYIGRGSKWGNPFKIGKDGSREEVIIKYREYLMNNKNLMQALPELRGKVLGCFCKPKPCHGDVLVEFCESEVKNDGRKYRLFPQGINGRFNRTKKFSFGIKR